MSRQATGTVALAVPAPRRVLAIALALAGLAACDSGGSATGTERGPVEFIDLRAEDVAATRAVIRFETNRPTTCEVEFGLSPDSLDRRATDPSMAAGLYATDHEVPLEDLLPDTIYHYRARATDATGETFRSELRQLTTAVAPAATILVNYAELTRGTTVAAVSSNFGGAGNADTWGANAAIDGLMATEWATDGDGDGAWIELDFGQERRLTRFEFRSRRMADGSAIVRRLQLRFDGGAPLGPYATSDPDSLYAFELPSPVTARTVRVEAVETTGGNTGAREIRLLGPAIDAP